MDTTGLMHARTDLTFAIAIALGQNSLGYRITNDLEDQSIGQTTDSNVVSNSDVTNNNSGMNDDFLHSSVPTLGSKTFKFNDTGQQQSKWSTITVHLSTVVSTTNETNASSNSLLIASPASIAQHLDTNTVSENVGHLSVSPIDIVIVSFILITWFIVIGVFIHKWQHLQIVEPREYRFQHKPKNLDSIKVVKRPSDSVIYRAYPVAMTKTMAAREKRLSRMHTMPAIKVDLENKSPAIKLKKELETHIPILCLQSMDDLGDISDDEPTEKQFMLKPVQV